jgi:hypothetical protein
MTTATRTTVPRAQPIRRPFVPKYPTLHIASSLGAARFDNAGCSTTAPIRGVPQGACRTQNPKHAKARR